MKRIIAAAAVVAVAVIALLAGGLRGSFRSAAPPAGGGPVIDQTGPAETPNAVGAAAGAETSDATGTSAPARNKFLTQFGPIYANLKSYADSGIVEHRATGFVSRYAFKTNFRAPTDFYLEFNGLESIYDHGSRVPLENHFVFWMFNGDLQTWNGDIKSHQAYRRGVDNQVTPINAGSAPTEGVSQLLTPLMFQNAEIPGVLHEIVEVEHAGKETINGKECDKFTGIAQSVYPSGGTFNVRRVAIWVDSKTQLIRKVFSDTPRGFPAGEVNQYTYIIEPRANPPLTDAHFQFDPPIDQ